MPQVQILSSRLFLSNLLANALARFPVDSPASLLAHALASSPVDYSGKFAGKFSGKCADPCSGNLSGRFSGKFADRFSGKFAGKFSGKCADRFSGKLSGRLPWPAFCQNLYPIALPTHPIAARHFEGERKNVVPTGDPLALVGLDELGAI